MLLGRICNNVTVDKRSQKTCRQVHPVGQLQQIVEKSRLLFIEVHMHIDNAAGWLVCGSHTRRELSERRQLRQAPQARRNGRPARSAEKSAT
jgi:hypothetical protein